MTATNLNDCGIEEINEIIKNNAASKKLYSKTYAEHTYTPLTITEKRKFLADLGPGSNKRLQLYSDLFKEIKTQITFISNNITASLNENEQCKTPLNKIQVDKNYNRSYNNMINIDEENDISEFSIDIDSKSQNGINNHSNKRASSNTFRKLLKDTKSKNIIKINNPNVLLRKGTELDCDVEDEDFKQISLPIIKEYQSNNIKNIEYLSKISVSESWNGKNLSKIGSIENMHSPEKK